MTVRAAVEDFFGVRFERPGVDEPGNPVQFAAWRKYTGDRPRYDRIVEFGDALVDEAAEAVQRDVCGCEPDAVPETDAEAEVVIDADAAVDAATEATAAAKTDEGTDAAVVESDPGYDPRVW